MPPTARTVTSGTSTRVARWNACESWRWSPAGVRVETEVEAVTSRSVEGVEDRDVRARPTGTSRRARGRPGRPRWPSCRWGSPAARPPRPTVAEPRLQDELARLQVAGRDQVVVAAVDRRAARPPGTPLLAISSLTISPSADRLGGGGAGRHVLDRDVGADRRSGPAALAGRRRGRRRRRRRCRRRPAARRPEPARIRLLICSPSGWSVFVVCLWGGGRSARGRSSDQLHDAGAARRAAAGAAGRGEGLGEPAVDAGLGRGAEAGAAGDRGHPVAREAVAGQVERREPADVVAAVGTGQPVGVVVDRQEDRRPDQGRQDRLADVRDRVARVVVDPALVVDRGRAGAGTRCQPTEPAGQVGPGRSRVAVRRAGRVVEVDRVLVGQRVRTCTAVAGRSCCRSRCSCSTRTARGSAAGSP